MGSFNLCDCILGFDGNIWVACFRGENAVYLFIYFVYEWVLLLLTSTNMKFGLNLFIH